MVSCLFPSSNPRLASQPHGRLRLLLRPGRGRRLELEPLFVCQVQEADEAETRADIVELLRLVLGLQALNDAAEFAALAEGGVFVVVDVLKAMISNEGMEAKSS